MRFNNFNNFSLCKREPKTVPYTILTDMGQCKKITQFNLISSYEAFALFYYFFFICLRLKYY